MGPFEVPRRLSRTDRTAHLLKQIQDDLPPGLSKAMPALSAEQPTAVGVLRAWRRLSRAADLSATHRYVVRENVINALARLFARGGAGGPPSVPFTPADFGVAGYRELADLFITTLERVGYGKAKLSDLPNLRQLMVGELLEQIVRNCPSLSDELKDFARRQLASVLNKGGELVDATGTKFTATRDFGPVRRAGDLWVTDTEGTRKFIDTLYVSTATLPDGRLIVAILVEVEVKMPTAARKAGKQIGRAQARFELPDDGELILNIEGLGVKQVKPTEVVFLPQQIERNLVTVGNTPDVRFRFTRRGGYDEVFRQITLEMKAQSLRQLVAAGLP